MTAVNDLLLATNNSKKIQEIRQILGIGFAGRILCAADFPELPEPEETGTTFLENARLKADYYCSRTGLISLADDSGLVVDALGGRPGVYSARYAETEALRISKLISELDDVPPPLRTARFECALCVALPGGKYIEQTGTLEGRIAHFPKGSHGFGYDPVFLVGDTESTLAELPATEKNSISHRAVAMKKIQADLLNALIVG